MEDFATYILNEKNYIQKMLIVNYMAKKTGIYFDKSIILRTEIARMFLKYASIEVDANVVLTAMLLCNCKKVDNSQKIGKLETYAKEGAEYLATLGFDKRFCKICEEVNRYSGSNPREKESDIIELVDQFSGLIIRRIERDAYSPKEALVIIKERNLKNIDNRYLEDFILFVNAMENAYIKDTVEVPVLKKLAFLCERSIDVKSYIAALGNRYSVAINQLIKNIIKEQAEEFLYEDSKTDKNANIHEKMETARNKLQTAHRYTRVIQKKNSEKALFSSEVANRVLNHESTYKI